VLRLASITTLATAGLVSIGTLPRETTMKARPNSFAAPSVSLIVPTLTSGSRAVVRTRQPVIRATFLPNATAIDTTKTVLSWRGETVTGLARHNRGLIEWEVDSTRWLGIGDSAQVQVTACDAGSACSTVSRWVVLENDQKPVLGFTGMALEELDGGFSAPFGPGLTVSGPEVETGFSIPSYTSMGEGHGAGLVYSTRTSYPRALVPVDLELPWPVGTPDQIKLVLIDGVTRMDSLVVASPDCSTGAVKRCRAVLQADFSGTGFTNPTRKWLKVEASVTSSGVTKMGTDSAEVTIVDRRQPRYGSGWWPAGVSILQAAGNDRLLIQPNGTVSVYRGNGDSLYIPPPGVYEALVKTASGWELRPRGSTAKDVFDSSGRLVKSVDQNGNRDSVAWGSLTHQITKLIDPVGKQILFGYDVNNKLSTITAPGSRQSKIVIDASSNQLTYDSVSSPWNRPIRHTYAYKTYPGTLTLVLTKRVGTVKDTTIISYDSTFRRRPVTARLAKVEDETGASVNPVITYAPYESRGVGRLVSLDSLYAEMKDPRNNWTRSLLNRWGDSRKTWDAIGVISRTEYAPDGLTIWTEGKNGDSSRVYNDYDGARRLVRTWISRGGDVLRLDSLVYDANHRVIQQIDPRGQISRTDYDANGNVIRSITPNSDTTFTWYAGDGLVDSTRQPGQTASTRFSYDAMWKNLAQVTDPAGEVVSTITYDNYGRPTTADRKVEVQVSGGALTYQWQRVQTWYTFVDVARYDSTVTFRTNNCAAPCNTPSWPAASDTLRTRRVRREFSEAGLDSIRYNDRGIKTVYAYDRLGRLVSRRPWSDSLAVKDSMAYDVAGNLKKTITRRGDTITTNYDQRNRDTLTVIPGVGTLRKQYGGPQDQLTRQWYDTPVDSIGGINAELRWAYDTRGRLRADTSYTGSTVQSTTYTYDQWDRVNSMVDPVGIWTTGYETLRGYADTLITPLGDTLTYVHDKQGRAVGPYIRSGGLKNWSELGWNPNESLDSLGTMTQGSGGSFISGRYVRPNSVDDGYIALEPFWVEQHGAGMAVDSLADVVAYDGWERLTSWTAKKNGVTVANETYQFDRTGNISQPTGAATYDPTTDRLLTRVETGGNRAFVYDRAGNLIQQSKQSTGEVRTFGYDALNRLVSVRQDGILMARYAYDVMGRRIAKRVYSSASNGVPGYTRFVYHGDHVAFQADSSGTVGLRFTWGLGTDDLRAATDGAGQHYYIVQDKLGSVRGLYQRDGTWRASVRFNPYGDLVAIDSSGAKPAIWYSWTGRELDEETGWYYHRARYYSPLIRRFVQEDPIGYEGSANLYAYVEGQVLEATDPSGTMMKNVTPSGGVGGLPGAGTGGYDQLSAVFGSGAGYIARAQARLRLTTFKLTISYRGQTETIVFRGIRATNLDCRLCRQMPDGGAAYAGIVGDIFSPASRGVGSTLAAGVFVDNKGSGFYYRVGFGGGKDVSAGYEYGYSSSFAGVAFEGQIGINQSSFSVSASVQDWYRVAGGGWSSSSGWSFYTGTSGHVAGTYTGTVHTGYWPRVKAR
jgi:RHS repeat-associated protein